MNSKKKDNPIKKVKSIAIKINSTFVSKLFNIFIILDIVILSIVIGLWCFQGEYNYFGEISEVSSTTRHLDIFPIESAKYTVSIENGATMVMDGSVFFNNIRIVGISLLTFQGIILILQIIFGTYRIKKILRPIDEIAETANRLSNMSFDEHKVQNLEEAISKISPVINNERIHTDDSELKGLENAINDLLERMRETYKIQARFVSDASHELRTPISVIQGYANMLDRWGKEDENVLNESILAIKSESENMKTLVEQLLFLARGTNGKTQVSYKNFSLNEMIYEVFEESKMIDENHIYEYECTGEITVFADEALLKQCARILIENAAKYTNNNEIIKLKVGINEKNEKYFSVQDSGIGMDEEDIPHIFERFFRADTARDRKTGGTGLGLSIAKWIVDSHRGYFSVLSRKGIGTRISVYLP